MMSYLLKLTLDDVTSRLKARDVSAVELAESALGPARLLSRR